METAPMERAASHAQIFATNGMTVALVRFAIVGTGSRTPDLMGTPMVVNIRWYP